jgi:hypothetical protein
MRVLEAFTVRYFAVRVDEGEMCGGRVRQGTCLDVYHVHFDERLHRCHEHVLQIGQSACSPGEDEGKCEAQIL